MESIRPESIDGEWDEISAEMELNVADVIEIESAQSKKHKAESAVNELEEETELKIIDVIDYLREPFYVPENGLFDFRELENRYFVIRHGESTANERGLVVSDPGIGTIGYGLTGKGRGQIDESARDFLMRLYDHRKRLAGIVGDRVANRKLKMDKISKYNTVVLSSDFRRAMETAEIFAEVVGVRRPKPVKALRERFFGDYDMKEGNIYEDVWSLDAKNYNQQVDNVESVGEVLARSTRLIRMLERSYKGKNIFLVAHGDVGQILETGFRKMNPSMHRSLPHLKNAEIREMWLNPLM